MKTLLAVDIGNTNITVGLFKGKKLLSTMKIPTNAYSLYMRDIRHLINVCDLNIHDAPDVIISSVVPLALVRLIAELHKIMKVKVTILGRDLKVPIRNMYKIKSEVGQDRLVNAYAAKAIYGAPAVIVDFGTAITFDIVSRRGDYLGGLILPGIKLSLSSLYHKTALLPNVELKPASSIIGKDTVDSMRGGILFGFGTMCDGLVAKYKKILGKSTKIIATGGNSKLIKRFAKSIQCVDENLTLKGLQIISEIHS